MALAKMIFHFTQIVPIFTFKLSKKKQKIKKLLYIVRKNSQKHISKPKEISGNERIFLKALRLTTR